MFQGINTAFKHKKSDKLSIQNKRENLLMFITKKFKQVLQQYVDIYII